MGAIWSEQRRYETWLEVELAAADAMAEAALVPADDRPRTYPPEQRTTWPSAAPGTLPRDPHPSRAKATRP